MKNFKMNIEILLELIRARGFNIESFCRQYLLDTKRVITRQSIFQWRNGTIPSALAIKELSDYLGVSIDCFFKESDKS